MTAGIIFGITVIAACCGFSVGNLGILRDQLHIWQSQMPQQLKDVQ